MAKILCVLYPEPVDGYPPNYARDDIPTLRGYPDGQALPTPKAIDFTPGELLGCVSGELGLRRFLEADGHTLIVTSDKEGPDSIFERELADADIVISQPFWPALVRNFLPSHDWIVNGGWNIADSVERAYDLEGMNVGVLAAGRIGLGAVGVTLVRGDSHVRVGVARRSWPSFALGDAPGGNARAPRPGSG